MHEPTQPNQDEQISAYLDGELSPRDEAEVRRLLEDDPAAAQLADDLRAVSQTVRRAPAPRADAFAGDMAPGVLAEALRRQASGEAHVELTDRLEPEGDFGLPFGKSSRTWAWAGVAAAAAVMFGFFGRPGAPPQNTIAKSTPTTPAIRAASNEQPHLALQRVAPNIQLVNLDTTPQQYQQLLQRVSLQQGAKPRLPIDPNALKRAGVVVEPGQIARSQTPSGAQEQYLYLDAEQTQIDRLLAELEQGPGGSIQQVGPTPAPAAAPPSFATAKTAAMPQLVQKINAVPLRVRVSPDAHSLPVAVADTAPSNQPKRVIVLRIRIQPKTPTNP